MRQGKVRRAAHLARSIGRAGGGGWGEPGPRAALMGGGARRGVARGVRPAKKLARKNRPREKKLARRARASSRHPFGARPCPMPPVPLPCAHLRPKETRVPVSMGARAGARAPARARAEGRWCASRARSRERATNFFPRAPPPSVFLKRSALRAGGAGTCAGMCGVPWQGGERCGGLGAWGRYRGRRQRVGLRPGERPRGLRPSLSADSPARAVMRTMEAQ